MKCSYCEESLEHKKVIFEDDSVMAIIPDMALVSGQISVFPKQHFTILEMVPRQILQKCLQTANQMGIAVFEALGSQGTNFLISNGLGSGQTIPHFSIQVIPRRENDGLPLSWEPKPVPEDELEVTLALLKEELKNLKEVRQEEKKEVAKEELPKPQKESYLLKSLRKIP